MSRGPGRLGRVGTGSPSASGGHRAHPARGPLYPDLRRARRPGPRETRLCVGSRCILQLKNLAGLEGGTAFGVALPGLALDLIGGECAEPTWELRVSQRAPFPCMGRSQEGCSLALPLGPWVVAFSGQAQGGVRQSLG